MRAVIQRVSRAHVTVEGSVAGEIAAGLVIFLGIGRADTRSEEHTSELQSQSNLVCRLLLAKKKTAQRPGVRVTGCVAGRRPAPRYLLIHPVRDPTRPRARPHAVVLRTTQRRARCHSPAPMP